MKWNDNVVMPRWAIAACLAVGFLAVAGCSNEHVIATQDGDLIESSDEPEINEDTGMLEYEDDDGRSGQIPQSDVSEIQER